MRFSTSGKWTFGANATVSDKIRSKLQNLISAIKGADVKDGEKPVQLFGEILSNSEIRWEASCELNVEDFIAIQKEARDNDNHILEWYRSFGKDILNGARQTVAEAKEIVPEIQKISQDYEIQEIKNSAERENLRKEIRKSTESAESAK